MVFSGLVTAWRLGGWPTRRSPSSVKATIEGVVRMPSAFSITFGVLPSMTATHELVVPRSMPMTLPMLLPLNCGRPAGPLGARVGMSAAHPQTPYPAPWIRDSPHFHGLLAHIGGPPVPASQPAHEFAGSPPQTAFNGYRAIAAPGKGGW